jgi:hypothetical protein
VIVPSNLLRIKPLSSVIIFTGRSGRPGKLRIFVTPASYIRFTRDEDSSRFPVLRCRLGRETAIFRWLRCATVVGDSLPEMIPVRRCCFTTAAAYIASTRGEERDRDFVFFALPGLLLGDGDGEASLTGGSDSPGFSTSMGARRRLISSRRRCLLAKTSTFFC